MSPRCPRCGKVVESPQLCEKCRETDWEVENTRTLSQREETEGPSHQSTIDLEKELRGRKWELSPGQMVGHCKLEVLLGQGAMGVVWKAVHLGLQKTMAVKILPPSFAKEKKRVEMFLQEARSAAKLDHKNIIRVYDVGKWEDFYYLVMEYVEGTDLKEVLKKNKKLPPRHAAKVTLEVAYGLDAAHKAHIIHRDIKPANIMLARGGIVKISDFGLARPLAPGFGLTEDLLMGTPLYIAPECVDGERADHRSDLYSLGVTLYQCLTGEVPIKGKSIPEILIKQVNQTPLPPRKLDPSIPISLEKITKRLLEKNPDNRYQTAEELAKDLEQFLEGKKEVQVFVPSEKGIDLTRERFLKEKAKRLAWERRKQQILVASFVLFILFSPLLFYLARPTVQTPTFKVPEKRFTPLEWLNREMAKASSIRELQRLLERTKKLFGESSPEYQKVWNTLLEKQQELWKKEQENLQKLIQKGEWDKALGRIYYQLKKRALLPFEKELRQKMETLLAKIHTHWQMVFVPEGRVRLPGGEEKKVGPFLASLYEVTNQEFYQFLKEKNIKAPSLPDWQGGKPEPGKESWPVRGVTYFEATEYASYHRGRLPTLEEWLYMAVGNQARRFPYGEHYQVGLANDLLRGLTHPLPVHKLKETSPFGIVGMAGNVSEWTSTKGSQQDCRYVAGGNYFSTPAATSPYFSIREQKVTHRNPLVGFRIIRDISPFSP